VFDSPGEAFVRLWALRPLVEPPGRERFDEELRALGLDPEIVRRRAAASSQE
jgi:hypothetical protein